VASLTFSQDLAALVYEEHSLLSAPAQEMVHGLASKELMRSAGGVGAVLKMSRMDEGIMQRLAEAAAAEALASMELTLASTCLMARGWSIAMAEAMKTEAMNALLNILKELKY
jgi:hypothetical protein